ncbi:Serine kinase [Chytriomyces hyalinus]|nr:Serine kinase [Chytriomyces hyalinus]
MDILPTARHQQGSPEVRYHCLYMYYYQGFTNRAKLACMFEKVGSTITHWIQQYEEGGGTDWAQRETVYKKHGLERRQWLVNLYCKRLVLLLKEAKDLYALQFPGSTVSTSMILCILKEAGLTWKVLERRAIQISQADIVQFTEELMALPWILENLVFLDEVLFDNQDMLTGYGMREEKLIYCSEFTRKPHVSLLCFIGIGGLLETYPTDGTFDCTKFTACCHDFALSQNVQQYPGQHSVWILDRAQIHCDKNILVFGMIKGELKKEYKENN